jgi:DNA helicase-4
MIHWHARHAARRLSSGQQIANEAKGYVNVLMQSKGSRQISRSLPSWLLRCLIGQPLRRIRVGERGLELIGSKAREILYTGMSGPMTGAAGRIIVRLDDGSEWRAGGFGRSEIATFIEAANFARSQHLTDLFDEAEAELRLLAQAAARLDQPRRYPAACLLEPFVQRARAVCRGLPTSVPVDLLSGEQQEVFNAVLALCNEAGRLRDAAINRFIDAELDETGEFFDTIESNPLTAEQRRAVVTDEDAVLVLAGAGSGKTSVIVAKAAYIIERGIRAPDEILLLAFGKDAAEEMATRIRKRNGASVDAMTFHALGYEIIRQVEGQAPALVAHASDDTRYYAHLREILLTEIATRDGPCALLLSWFAEFYRPYKTEWDFRTAAEYEQYVRDTELRTLSGDLVKSFEELVIANWLYLNGIAYEYEPDYEHALPDNERRAYTPDFRLTESGVYIEHFGVRKAVDSDGKMRLKTAPHVDFEQYLEGMEWKRKVHKAHGTILIETFSYENVEGKLLSGLRDKLAPYVKTRPVPPAMVFERLAQLGQVDAFTQTLGIFLRHFKSGGLAIEQCRERAEASPGSLRARAFLKIFELLHEAYETRLGDRIDFEDMIGRATEHVKQGRYRSPYRHFLVDEFQDMSDGRAALVLALKAQHADARIFAVGDDWQSIYRFAGSDLHLMRHFGEVFGGSFAGEKGVHSVVDLGRTFRNVDRIALAARRFVLQNPAQITKEIIPAAKIASAAIRLIEYARNTEAEALRAALDAISASASGTKSSVLLLGRYRFVEPLNLAELSSHYPGLDIRFLTVHRSKGLEADHVVILRAASGRMGFPSEIVDDTLLDLVLPEPETFAHAEERRLFYVAMTRARHSVTVMIDRDNPSMFATELLEDRAYGAVLLGAPTIAE